MIGFVLYSFKPRHPLLDLRLFRNRNLTIASVTLFVFIIAFMGAGLLFPSYFLQVRGESTLAAGLLMAPQGIGAMITMPIAGMLADKVPVGRTVPFALALIVVGFFTFTQVDPDTSYCAAVRLAVRDGPGHGRHDDADHDLGAADADRPTRWPAAPRWSTSSSRSAAPIGAAVMSVILTNELNGSRPIPGLTDPRPASRSPRPGWPSPPSSGRSWPSRSRTRRSSSAGSSFAADSFATTFWVGFALVLATFIPVAFLPRRRQPVAPLDDQQAEQPKAPVIIH